MINVQRKLVLAAIAVTLGIAGSVSYAFDQSSVDNMEQVVISIKTNPLKDPEPACVALQIGINLLMDLNGTVLPADKVILFPTIDGV